MKVSDLVKLVEKGESIPRWVKLKDGGDVYDTKEMERTLDMEIMPDDPEWNKVDEDNGDK